MWDQLTTYRRRSHRRRSRRRRRQRKRQCGDRAEHGRRRRKPRRSETREVVRARRQGARRRKERAERIGGRGASNADPQHRARRQTRKQTTQERSPVDAGQAAAVAEMGPRHETSKKKEKSEKGRQRQEAIVYSLSSFSDVDVSSWKFHSAAKKPRRRRRRKGRPWSQDRSHDTAGKCVKLT